MEGIDRVEAATSRCSWRPDVVLDNGIPVLEPPRGRLWDVTLNELLYQVTQKPKRVTLKLNLRSTEVLPQAFGVLMVALTEPYRNFATVASNPARATELSSAQRAVLYHAYRLFIVALFWNGDAAVDHNSTVHVIHRVLQNLVDLWIHADVLSGSAGKPPVEANLFMRQSLPFHPFAIISLGWNTKPKGAYSWGQVESMARLASCGYPFLSRVAFKVRASMVEASLAQLSWLFDVMPNATLVVWYADGEAPHPNMTHALRMARLSAHSRPRPAPRSPAGEHYGRGCS
ncbi:hypothetical protein HPB51_008686 [Rhipicephalus microplus]|uniref:Menorin-like domain-containing protein n=1 Tax=Rhipicephalus microplus TaxID=6941 RepID=A0A9J6EZ74_RHIMP|nr:hypothetical protein HPB51_008686 [Rhipicephalus microplus]